MVRERDFVASLGTLETRIKTASKNQEEACGVFGTPRAFFFPSSKVGVGFGQKNRAVFCEKLSENLGSVGRLCEAGFSVVFDASGYRIFRGKLQIRHREVHKQDRDPRTGLYPLTLITPRSGSAVS